MNAKAMQVNYQQMKAGMKFRALVAMTAMAIMVLAGAKPAFAHGPNNPRWFGPDRTWHFGTVGGHGGGSLWCDFYGYGHAGRVWVEAPTAPTSTHWRYLLNYRVNERQAWQAYGGVSGCQGVDWDYLQASLPTRSAPEIPGI